MSGHLTEEILQEERERYYAFINLAMFLAVLTSIEIVIIFLPFASWVIISSLVVLSVIKFFCVILWFMHLIYDKLLCTLLFLAGLIIAVATTTALLLLFAPSDTDSEVFEANKAPAEIHFTLA